MELVVVDALGMYHYINAYRHRQQKSAGGDDEQILTSVLRQVLGATHVAVFVSKCALYDDVVVPAQWPFPDVAVPFVPDDFMPPAWASLVEHTVLIYHVEGRESRAVVALRTDRSAGALKGTKRPRAVVCAAGALRIDNDGIHVSEEKFNKQ